MDVEQIDNFLSNESSKEVQYSDAQWLYITDTNNNNYNNVISFKTSQLKQQFVDYHNAVLAIPMTINVNVVSTFATRPPIIAMRNSVLDLIGLQTISTDQGQTIVNERDTHLINNVRLAIEHSIDWVYSNGSELDFAVDRPVKQLNPNQTLSSGYSFATFTAGTGVVENAGVPITNDPVEFVETGSDFTGRSPTFNQGFLDRVTIFQNTANYSLNTANTPNTHQYTYTAYIPLKLMHDFWMQLNFPIINIGFDLQFYLNQFSAPTTQTPVAGSPQANYPPFMTSNNVANKSSTDTTLRPVITYGQNGSGANSWNGCRLYYRVVKFSPDTTSEVASRLTSGFTKSVKFLSTDVYYPTGATGLNGPGYTSNPTVQQTNLQLVQSVVHPLRLWMLPFVSGALQTDTYATQVMPAVFTNTNILVNNLPYYRQAQQTLLEKWTMLSEQFAPDMGSVVRYEDWANFKQMLCFDLTRLSDRLSSPTEPVSLAFSGLRSDTYNFLIDLVFLCERQNQVTFRFSSSDVAIVVGNLD